MLKNNYSKGNQKIFAKFLLTKNNQQKTIYLKGQNARAIIALKEAGAKGITSLQIDELRLLRLSSYIHILRHEHGVEILTIREGESRIARYVLIDAVELVKPSISESVEENYANEE